MQVPRATLLNLKNIYRLLTQADFPFPSDIPLGRGARRGLTIHGFYRDTLMAELPSHPLGDKLWAAGEQRNRYLSDLFNRSQPAQFYPEYFEAAAQALTPQMLLNLVRRLDAFLEAARYNHSALCQRVTGYLKLVAQEDMEIIPAVHTFLGELTWQAVEFESDSARARFFCAYTLGVSALHAFFGLRMNNGPLARLRREAAFTPEALFKASRSGQSSLWPSLLTGTASDLCREPLEEALFFGRERELNQLREAIRQGGKILVSGMGGIGKTELLRQALRTLLRDGLFSQVAFVQYRGNLMDSFLAAFQDLHGYTPLTRFSECLNRLNQGSGRTLLLLDSMDTPPGEDPDLGILQGLQCEAVITSRLNSLDGFRTFPLIDPGLEAANSIFRANYGREIQAEEQELLDHLLDEHIGAHPLMCTVLGSMARSRHLGIRALYDSLETKGLKGTYVRQAQAVSVEGTLLQLYHATSLKKEYRALLRLIALLPPRSYHFSSLLELCRDISQDRDQLADLLETLRYLGWLNNREESYSMHPVIAGALLTEPVKMAEFPLFFTLLAEKTQQDKHREWTYVDIASATLHKMKVTGDQGFWLLMGTASLLLEKNLHAAMRSLMDRAWALLQSFNQQDPGLLFAWYAQHIFYLRTCSLFDQAGEAVGEILRLFPLTKKPMGRPNALGNALYFTLNLNLRGEMDALLNMLTESPWEEPMEQAQYCYAMGEFHVYATRNCREMTAWGEKGLDALMKAGQSNSLHAANLHHVAALGCAYCGKPQEARRHIERCKRLITDWYGDTDALVFAAFDNSLGTAYDTAGDYEGAIASYQNSLARFRRLLPGDSSSTEDVLNNLANAYLHQGDLTNALSYAREAFSMHTRQGRGQSLQSALLLNNMGAILRDSGRLREALAHFTEARRIARLLAGDDSIIYAEPTLNTGRVYLLMGEKAEALAHMEEALPLFVKHYGEEHPRTRMAQEKRAEALAWARK